MTLLLSVIPATTTPALAHHKVMIPTLGLRDINTRKMATRKDTGQDTMLGRQTLESGSLLMKMSLITSGRSIAGLDSTSIQGQAKKKKGRKYRLLSDSRRKKNERPRRNDN